MILSPLVEFYLKNLKYIKIIKIKLFFCEKQILNPNYTYLISKIL